MEYVVDWFERSARPYFEEYLWPRASKLERVLQVGAFTGDASEWIMRNTAAHLDDVDPFVAYGEFPDLDWDALKDQYVRRMRRWPERSHLYRTTSRHFFAVERQPIYDFVYVDGGHDAPTVLEDAIGALRVLKNGGLLAFDDYTWVEDGPRRAVDAFIEVYRDQIEVVDLGVQAWVRKDLRTSAAPDPEEQLAR